ncbi:MAG: hypothetical protein AB7G54_08555, partial [Methyloceanibacter sp.]
MTTMSLNFGNSSDQKAIREQLARILRSRPFAQARRMQRFLEYVVNEALAGRNNRLKAYNIALEVFDRPETFDPIVDPLVRVEAARLREKLREYYGTEGQGDAIHIDLPKGAYTPHIAFGQPVAARRWTPRGFPAVSLAAVLLALLAGFTAWKWWTLTASLPEKASIAVLPFDNIGMDSNWDRFADGVTEDIVTDLSPSKDLFVVAR